MKSQAPATVDIGEYQHGYHFPDESVFKTRKGLDEEIVNAISHRKEEPEWMRQFRLRSLRAFQKKSMPNWGADLSDLDFDNLYYYARPQDQQSKSWDDVPANIKETFERIGIPEAERKFLAGVGRAVRLRDGVPQHQGRAVEAGRHLHRPRDRGARAPRPREAVLRHGHSLPGQQVRRSQQRRVVGREASSTCPRA